MSEVKMIFFREDGTFCKEVKEVIPTDVADYNIREWITNNIYTSPDCSITVTSEYTNITPMHIDINERSEITEAYNFMRKYGGHKYSVETDNMFDTFAKECRFSAVELLKQFREHTVGAGLNNWDIGLCVGWVYYDLQNETTNSWWHKNKERKANDGLYTCEVINIALTIKNFQMK